MRDILIGDNIYLRLLERDDLKKRVKWINDREINQNLGFDFPANIDKTNAWFQNTLMDSSRMNFSIVDTESKQVIGMAGFLGINMKNRNAEFYITIGEKGFWGKGIADDSIKLLLDYAFKELGLEKVYLHTFDYNKRAGRVYERNGFKKEGIFRKHIWKQGELRDIIYYSILKNEWSEFKEDE